MEMETEDPWKVGADAEAPSQFSAPRALSCLTALAVDKEVVLGSAFNSVAVQQSMPFESCLYVFIAVYN